MALPRGQRFGSTVGIHVQWGFEIWKHLKSRLFEDRIYNGPVFKKSGFNYGFGPNHSKTGCFCQEFKWFLTKWQPILKISKGRASGFQIPFEICTICNQTSFRPFKIQTSSDFRSPLHY